MITYKHLSDVEKKKAMLEHQFRCHAGPIANSIIPKVEKLWRSKFPIRMATLLPYLKLLSMEIIDTNVRTGFYNEAARRIISK